jgi:DNA adenine methylase
LQEIIERPAVATAGSAASPRTTPFLRWAGGKRWLVPQILTLLDGKQVDNYHEPFLGGGSVFLALSIQGQSHLSDLNNDLIEVYTQVRDHPNEVATAIAKYRNTAEDYYAARASKPEKALERAARFIYLNHTSFNGIFRVNLRGEYNVPFGNRPSPNFPDAIALSAVASRLKSATLMSKDFEASLSKVGPGDLVFLDPPYTVAHNNNGFVKYNQHLFSFDDQKRLAAVIASIRERGADFILTNAAHSSIDALFSPLGRRLTVSRRNVVGGVRAGRGRAEEYLFTSIGA